MLFLCYGTPNYIHFSGRVFWVFWHLETRAFDTFKHSQKNAARSAVNVLANVRSTCPDPIVMFVLLT